MCQSGSSCFGINYIFLEMWYIKASQFQHVFGISVACITCHRLSLKSHCGVRIVVYLALLLLVLRLLLLILVLKLLILVVLLLLHPQLLLKLLLDGSILLLLLSLLELLKLDGLLLLLLLGLYNLLHWHLAWTTNCRVIKMIMKT